MEHQCKDWAKWSTQLKEAVLPIVQTLRVCTEASCEAICESGKTIRRSVISGLDPFFLLGSRMLTDQFKDGLEERQ